MKIFSTLQPDQIDERRTQAEGVLGLKEFLRFASGREVYSSTATKDTQTNTIIQEIAQWLVKKGYDVDMNVGSSDCKIDIAVVRPSVFGRLGWSLLRISTIDYFQKPDMVKKRISDAL